MRFKSGEQENTKVTDIGRLQGTGKLFNFNENAQLVGFYGSSDENHITSLGFITYDRKCQEEQNALQALQTLALTASSDEEDEDIDDGSSGLGALIAICASSLILLGLLGGLLYWFCIRKSKNKQSFGPKVSQVTPVTGAEENSKTGTELSKKTNRVAPEPSSFPDLADSSINEDKANNDNSIAPIAPPLP